jgi:formylmethanofuran dehydrogenase subunit E
MCDSEKRQKAAAFYVHKCPGLAIGVKAYWC